MTITVADVDAIKELVSTDPALCEELRGASSREDFTQKLVAAARAKDIVLDEAALGQGLNIVFDQFAENGELSDADLEHVAGGIGPVTLIGLGVVVGLVVGVGAGVGAATLFNYLNFSNNNT